MMWPLNDERKSLGNFGTSPGSVAAPNSAPAHLVKTALAVGEGASKDARGRVEKIPTVPLDYAHTCMNHFVVLDLRETGEIATHALSALAITLCSSPLCDDLLVLQPSTMADVRLRILGGDGLEADFCANGLLYTSSKIGDELGREAVTVETPAGVRHASRNGDEWQAEVGLAERLDLDPAVSGHLPVLGLMRAGEPHLVLSQPVALPGFNIDRRDFERYCRPLRDLVDIPGGINVTVVFQQMDNNVLIRTFERGVGRHTFSCGTGAIAAIAAVHGTPDRAAHFHVCSPGGMHSVFFDGARWHLAARPVRIGSGVLRDGQLCLPLEHLQHYRADPAPTSSAG